MTLSPLIALAGSAAGSFVAGAAKGVLEGVSNVSDFSQHLNRQVEDARATEASEASEAEARASELADLHQAALQHLRDAGIDVSQPIRFFGGSTGPWMVQGAHPDLLRIEQLLGQHDEFRSTLQQIEARVNEDSTAAGSFEISDVGIRR